MLGLAFVAIGLLGKLLTRNIPEEALRSDRFRTYPAALAVRWLHPAIVVSLVAAVVFVMLALVDWL